MQMIHIEIRETGERRRIDREVWVLRQRNGIIVSCTRAKAQGVSDGAQIWSLGSLEGYPGAKVVTKAEYEEHLTPPEEDPELSAEEALNILLGGNHETE